MDKKQFEKIGIIAFILFMLLAIVWGIYKLVKGKKKKEPKQVSPRTLKPLKSAKVEAVKTGVDNGKGVSGYSFMREYDVGTCTFTTAMNKYVTLNVTLAIEQEEYLQYIDGVRATWKIQDRVLSTQITSFNPPTSMLGTSLQIQIPVYTDTAINIACDGASVRRDNEIFIEYSSTFTSDYTPWGKIEMTQGLGNEITNAFDTIPPGKGILLEVTLVAATVSGVTQSQDIPYKFTAKSGGVITGINLETGSTPNEYIMKYKGTTLNIKTYKIEGIATYNDYVAAKVIGGDHDGKFIYFAGDNKDLSYRVDYDDSCFFKIELDSRDCVYSPWSPTDPSGASCPTACGYGGAPQQTRTFTPALGGGSCPNPNEPLSRTCGATPVCPVDCAYSEWANKLGATCSKTCGSGTIEQTRTITTQAAGTGTACNTNLLTRYEPCNTQACTDANCIYSGTWVDGTVCSVTACGSQGTFTDTQAGVRPDGQTCSLSRNTRTCNTSACTIWDSSRINDNFEFLVTSPNEYSITFYWGVFSFRRISDNRLMSTITTGITTGSPYARFVNGRLVVTNGTTTVRYPSSDNYAPGAGAYLKMTSTQITTPTATRIPVPILTLNTTGGQPIYRWPVRSTLDVDNVTGAENLEHYPIVNEGGGGALIMQQDGNLCLYDRTGTKLLWALGTGDQDVIGPYVLGALPSGRIAVFGKKANSGGNWLKSETPSVPGYTANMIVSYTPTKIVVEQDQRTNAGPNAVCFKIMNGNTVYATNPAVPSST